MRRFLNWLLRRHRPALIEAQSALEAASGALTTLQAERSNLEGRLEAATKAEARLLAERDKAILERDRLAERLVELQLAAGVLLASIAKTEEEPEQTPETPPPVLQVHDYFSVPPEGAHALDV